MTTLDIIVLLLLAGGAVLGGLRGFVTEVLSLFAWGATLFALKLLHAPVAALLTPLVGSASGAAVLAFALIAVAVYVGGRMTARAIGRRTRSSVLGPLDRVLGVGFGMLKGLLIATLGFLAINLVFDMWSGKDARRPDWMRASRTYPLLNASGRAVVDFVHRRRGDPIPGQDKIGNALG